MFVYSVKLDVVPEGEQMEESVLIVTEQESGWTVYDPAAGTLDKIDGEFNGPEEVVQMHLLMTDVIYRITSSGVIHRDETSR